MSLSLRGSVVLCTLALAASAASAAHVEKRTAAGRESAGVSPTAGTCVVTPITCNTTVSSALVATDCTSDTTAKYIKKFTFNATAGEGLEIAMTAVSQTDLDTYVELVDPNGVVLASNDDIVPGEDTDSKIQTVANLSGVYTINATSWPDASSPDTGSFTLTLNCGADFTPGQMFFTLAPCRVHDTRGASGPRLANGSIRTFQIAGGQCGVPTSARAVSVNFTVTNNGTGYLTVWPTGRPMPVVSTINFQGGGQYALANAAILPLGTNGQIDIFSAGDTDVIIDVNGFFK